VTEWPKSNRIVVILDGDQVAKLQRLAKASGSTMSAWLRAAVVQAPDPQLQLPLTKGAARD
jgi:predicted transcriptional regulator